MDLEMFFNFVEFVAIGDSPRHEIRKMNFGSIRPLVAS
jgi:hypothetical protein